MAGVRAWTTSCRLVRTLVKRAVRRPGVLERGGLSWRAYSDELTTTTSTDKVVHRLQLNEVQVQHFLEQLEEKAEYGGDVGRLLSDNSEVSDTFASICENASVYSTDVIVELLEQSHRCGVNVGDRLMPVAEELASRIDGMSFQGQQRALHTLWKLNLNHLHVAHETLDKVAFAQALRQNTVNEKTVSYTVFSLKDQSWSSELTEALQEYVAANAMGLNLRSVYQILSVMIEKRIATEEVVAGCAQSVAHTLTLDIPVSDRVEVWGSYYPNSLHNLLWAFGRLSFYSEELYSAFSSLVEGDHDPLLQTPRFISNLAWSCAKVRYYSESLMESIADISLKNLTEFKNQDLALLLYSYGFLNCLHLDLLNDSVTKIMRDPDHLDNTKLCWIVAWVSMVLEHYPEKLLSEMLTDDYLKCKLL